MVTSRKCGIAISYKDFGVCFLAFFWCFFLSIGVFVGDRVWVAEDFVITAPRDLISFFAALLFRIIPCIFTFCAIQFKRSSILYIIASFRSFCCGYFLSVYLNLFRSAGWLLWILDFSSELVFNITLLYTWVKFLAGDTQKLTGLCVLSLLLSFYDWFLIYSFVSSLISLY